MLEHVSFCQVDKNSRHTRTQFPVKLAWGITTHRAKGSVVTLSARVLASKIKTYINTGEGTITELMRHSFLSSQHKILQSQSMYESDKVSRNYRSHYPFRSNNYPGRSFIWKMVKSDFNKKLVKRVHWSSNQNWSKLHTLKIK